MLRKIKSLLNSNITALAIAVSIPLTAIFSNHLHIGFVLSIAILILFYFAYIVIYSVKQKRWKKNLQRNLIYKQVEHDWAISEKGDFSANIVYTVKNVGKTVVTVIPFDNGYWLEKPPKLDFRCKVLSSSKDHKIIEYRNTIYESLVKLFFGVKAYVISWSHSINPPLGPNDEFTFEISIETPSTEKRAFSSDGTYAGIPATIPTKQARLNFSAPKGYKFELLTPKIVLDQKGNLNDDETEHTESPVLSSARKTLTWRIDNLLTEHRYCFKYKMEKE